MKSPLKAGGERKKAGSSCWNAGLFADEKKPARSGLYLRLLWSEFMRWRFADARIPTFRIVLFFLWRVKLS